MIKRFLTSLTVFALLLSTASPVFLTAKAKAANAANWQAGRIIDDAVFTDANAMSVAQIQAFLDQKVGTGGYDSVPGQCDINGTRNAQPFSSGSRSAYATSTGRVGKFNCLSNFYEVPKTEPGPGVPANNYGGKPIPAGAISAAQMIYDASQRYQISPKVLLVTIHKESAGPLTTDDWPFESQYTYAMGAYCPDSGPNGSANCDPNYAGFSIQIAESARLMRYYLNNMNQPWWTYKKPGNNSIQFHPNVGCGSSNVLIESKATAALYTYTPYQPNQSALNNLYGSGDSCGAYGNRNFWRIYTDWFGSTKYSFGSIPSSSTPYARSKCSQPVFENGSVLRLYNPDTQDYLFTTDPSESCFAISYGYILDGEVFKSVAMDDSKARPVYRLSFYGKHLYTTDQAIKNSYISNGWNDEGVSFYGYSEAVADSVPVYQLGNDFTSVMTLYEGESKILDNYLDLNLYGIAMYAPSTIKNVGGDVFRLRNSTTRLYTPSNIEKDNAKKFGYYDEGIAFSSSSTVTPDTLPIYRLRNGANQYFYTNSRIERDLAVISYGYYSEGTGMLGKFNASSEGKSVYKLTNYFNGNRLYTVSVAERDSAINFFGYTFEGVAWYQY